MGVAVDLTSGFVECLLFLLALAAVRRGRRVYWVAVLGTALVLYARMADGFISTGMALALTVGGLVLAGLTVVADLLFEVVDDAGPEGNPPV